MAAPVNRQILLKSRPEGAPSLDNFTLKEGPVPEPGDGEVLMRTRGLSLDPYMRGRMSAAKSYAKPVEVGATMVGGTVGEVVASRNPNFAVGDKRSCSAPAARMTGTTALSRRHRRVRSPWVCACAA